MAIYGNLANLAAANEGWDETEHYFRQALDLSTEINNPKLSGLANHCLGITELLKSNLHQAEQHFMASLHIARQINYAEYQINV